MKLVEALRIVQKSRPAHAEPLKTFLACSFTPLHLQTFLAAHLQVRCPEGRVVVERGLYGDLLGSLERIGRMAVDAGAVILEWSDLDPRLGIRHLGGSGTGDLADILNTVRAKADLIREAIGRASRHVPLAICLPTLPLPPVSYTSGRQASAFELQLVECLHALAARVGECSNVKIVNPQRLNRLSPPGERLDVKSELLSGFPYRLAHASAIAQLLAILIDSPVAKKGLITDMDDTLWRGVLGEVGVGGISWDLDHHSHMHGLYQQLLRSLSEAGVLIAAASKNDPSLVDEAFRREDLILPKECLFPMEIHWGPKSESVKRILRAWNIDPQSVVFVDDSPLELAEVKAVHPEVECLLFPTQADQATYELLESLRDLFGKEAILEEDSIRLESLRSASMIREDTEHLGSASDAFLAQVEAELTVSFIKDPLDPRALELVNKTNQFNVNGRRFVEGLWRAHLQGLDTFLLSVSYKDKYGPLGKIAVLTGRAQVDTLWIDTWVMSCRAFSRRIEHKCLDILFTKFDAKHIIFDFKATERNGPLQEFFQEFLGVPPEPGFDICRELFLRKCPPLYHRVTEIGHG